MEASTSASTEQIGTDCVGYIGIFGEHFVRLRGGTCTLLCPGPLTLLCQIPLYFSTTWSNEYSNGLLAIPFPVILQQI